MSKKNFFIQAYTGMPEWAKGVVNVVVVGGTAFIGYKIYQGIKKRQMIERADQAARQAGTDLQVLAQRGIYPSYNVSQYEIFSQELAVAMAGCGTDNELIESVMRAMKNDADVLKLIQVFGVRAYEPCFYTNPIDHATWVWNNEAFPGSLGVWFAWDLSDGDISDINDILKSRGIQFRF